MTIDESIFKAYDIRGIYPESLDEELIYKIGHAFASLLQKENPDKKLQIVVGRDMRLSSPSLQEAVIRGIVDSGVNVVNIGLASTPTFYHAVGFYGFDGGLQVSASHNPREWNGCKMVRTKGEPVSGEKGIEEMKQMILDNNFIETDVKGMVTTKDNVLDDLVETQLKEWNIDPTTLTSFTIVGEAANAMGAIDMEAIFEVLPGDLIKVNFDLDGTFPVHEADPLKPENLTWAQDAVREHNTDLGIVTDGDGDRYFFIDDKGEPVPMEILRGIIAQEVLKSHPSTTICYDIRPGKITRDMIVDAGGTPSLTKVGHSLIKAQMLEVDAPFGGESSGHFFFKFPFGTFEAPTVFVGLLLKYLGENNKPLSELVAPYKKYFHSGEINSDVEDKEGKMKELAEKYSDADISWLDGVTVTYPDWWFNVRPSNTEPKLRLNLEAVSQIVMEEKRDEVLEIIRS